MSPKALLQHIASLQQAFVGHVAGLQTADPEALHDLRVSLRRLRTLLRPLTGNKACRPLYQAATVLFRYSNPLRDLQVLLADLEAHGATSVTAARQRKLHKALAGLAHSEELQALQAMWAAWQDRITVKKLPPRRRLKKRFRQSIARQQKWLLKHLRQTDMDLHRLRIHIKRLRYLLEAYKAGKKSPTALLANLSAAQTALGEWHDVMRYLASVETEPELAAHRERWQRELAIVEGRLPPLLKTLRKTLAGS